MATHVDSGWQIASTVATVGATLIALFMPVYLDSRLRKRVAKEKREELTSAAHEIIHAVEDALNTFDEAVELIKTDFNDISTGEARNIQERGRRSKSVIDLLMKRQGLTDGIIRCGVDGAALGEATAEALAKLNSQLSGAMLAQDGLNFNKIRAERARAQTKKLRQYYKLPEPRSVEVDRVS